MVHLSLDHSFYKILSMQYFLINLLKNRPLANKFLREINIFVFFLILVRRFNYNFFKESEFILLIIIF